MLFSGIPFLYYFFPAVVILYFLVPFKYKNIVLFLASLIFYGWGEPKYILLMMITITVNYVLAIAIEKNDERKKKRFYLILSLIFSLGALGYFKYMDFFIDNINKATNLSIPLLKIALPVGISFYTFQTISYVIDVYWGNTKAQKNYLSLATYVVLFPQLIAGPIVRYVDVAAELKERKHTMEQCRYGISRFLLGLGKKVLIANLLGELCSIFLKAPSRSVLFYWMYGIAFSLQIYFDFSGYSDMAIGIGRIFGFRFLENFNYPYISKSITEFWRRWHMSLGTWFRDYLYIPLGGNRVSKGRWFFNIIVVWMMTGFWHGAAWNFVFWGLFFAILLILEKVWLLDGLKKLPRIFSHIYVLLMVIISFVLFDAGNLSEAGERIGAMFGLGNHPLWDTLSLYYLRSYGVVFIIALIGATPLPKKLVQRFNENKKYAGSMAVLEGLTGIILLLVITAYLVDASFNPFLYFRF